MDSFQIIVQPLVTEKSNFGPQDGKYTFIVDKRANKLQIKRAVQERFKVKVKSVNTAIFKGKAVTRNLRAKSKKPNWKKAFVTLFPGETIPELYEDLG